MSEEQPHWSVDTGYASQAELRKYQARHACEYEACFANLERLLTLLKRGMHMRSFQLGFLRNEQGDLYRISQSGVAHAAETRLYVYPDSNGRILYVLGIGGKKRQPEDIQKFMKHIQRIKEQ